MNKGWDEGIWTMGFWIVCWNSWINPMASHLTLGPRCVDRRQEGGLAPRKLGKGGDDQTSFLFLLMPTLKRQERKLVMTLPLASAPLGCPLLSPTAPLPHSQQSTSCGHGKFHILPYG